MAKLRGVKFSRPAIDIPSNFNEIIKSYEKGNISSSEAITLSGLTRGTFYRKMHIIKQK